MLTVDQFFTDFFSQLRTQFTWSNLVILLIGVFLGFVLFTLLYTIVFITSIKKDQRFQVTINELDPDMEKELLANVDEIKKNYLNSTIKLKTKEKLNVLSRSSYEMVNMIAHSYYPNSKYPLYELTIQELLAYLHYLSNRIEAIFDKRFLRPFQKMSISQIFRFIDAKKRIEENKLVKEAKRLQFGKVRKALFSVLNYANPVYWFKNLVLNSAYNYALDKIALIVLDIIADETNKAYSKRVFNHELGLTNDHIEQALQELEEEDHHEE